MVSPEERDWMWQEYAPDPKMRLNQGIRRRLAPLLDNDPKKIRQANAILFSLPGTPIIYYGDEIGMGDNIDLFDRNGVRTPMQWTSESSNAGFTDSNHTYSPVITAAPYSPRYVNVADQEKDPVSLLNFMKRIIHLRKERPFLSEGSIEFFEMDISTVLCYIRGDGDYRMIALHNLGNTIAEVTLPVSLQFSPKIELLTNTAFTPGLKIIKMLPHQSVWLV